MLFVPWSISQACVWSVSGFQISRPIGFCVFPSVLIIVALQQTLTLGRVIPSPLFFVRIAAALLGLLVAGGSSFLVLHTCPWWSFSTLTQCSNFLSRDYFALQREHFLFPGNPVFYFSLLEVFTIKIVDVNNFIFVYLNLQKFSRTLP